MTPPLSTLRVLDLSRILAGPWATQILADLGAEVLKIERPLVGDDTRAWGPPFLPASDGRETDISAYFLSTNRGKRSLAIDFTRPEGQAVLRRLAAKSDIFVENFKVGGLAKYGLDYASLKKENPRLIYASITGFGQDGPYKERAGYDFMIQGMAGLMSVTGEPDERPGGGPMKVGVALSDIMTGLYTAIAVLAAMAAREQSGRGQHIDLALLDVQVATLANQALNYLVGGVVPSRLGNAHPNITPYERLRTADGYVILAVGNDDQFARFCEVAGRPELADEERFATNASRVAHRDELIPLVAELMESQSSAWWLERLETVGVPCGPINDIGQVFDDPHVKHRGMKIDLPHPLSGSVPSVASPMRFSDTKVQYPQAPPLLGQDTFDMLTKLAGLSPSELEALERDGVIARWKNDP